MARRNDHSIEEIISMATKAGHEILKDEGTARFSARKVAKKIGYTIGTIYNIFDSHTNLILHINAVTLEDMKKFILLKIKNKKANNYMNYIDILADSYIEFAYENYNCWSALFEFNLSRDAHTPKWYMDKIEDLFSLLETPLRKLLLDNDSKIKKSSTVLWASLHGICQLGITGKLNRIGVPSVQKLAKDLIKVYISGLESIIKNICQTN
jgi:hypothetical protein